ncbi:MAG: ATP-binding protein [Motiliproteus sp.]
MAQAVGNSKAPERLLLVGCIVGLFLIALVSSISHVLMQRQITEQHSGANIVNLSGRQRMLSQRLSKNALKVLASDESVELKHAFEEIKQAVAAINNTHQGLMYGDPDQDLPGTNSPVIERMFEEVNPFCRQLLIAGDELLKYQDVGVDRLHSLAEVNDAVAKILENEGPFLLGMSRIVFQYAQESETRLQHTNDLERLLFYSLMIILLLEAIFIFRPLIQRTLLAMALLRKNEQHLKEAQQHLQRTIVDLREAQENLLEVEKKAVLASVVAGLTHDVNTPIGVGITAVSALEALTRSFVQDYQQGSISRTAMEEYQDVAIESSGLILNNLQRAAELIRNFKQLAIDQSSEQRRHFNLKQYLDDIVSAMDAKLRTTKHHIEVHCPGSIELDSFPGALYQVVSNLIMNSLIHGFEHMDSGTIHIDARIEGDELLLVYTDNGCGMDSEVQSHLYEAFFTTKREQGGSGLGTHMIKTLVDDALSGSIVMVSSPGQGVEFRIRMPVVAEHD